MVLTKCLTRANVLSFRCQATGHLLELGFNLRVTWLLLEEELMLNWYKQTFKILKNIKQKKFRPDGANPKHLCPWNSSSYSWVFAFTELPHSFKVIFDIFKPKSRFMFEPSWADISICRNDLGLRNLKRFKKIIFNSFVLKVRRQSENPQNKKLAPSRKLWMWLTFRFDSFSLVPIPLIQPTRHSAAVGV